SGAGSANAIDWYSSVDGDKVATLYVTEDTGAADTTYYNLIAYPANTAYTQILIQGSGGTAFKIWDSLNIGEASIYHQDAGNSTQFTLGIYYTSSAALLLKSYSDRMIMFEDMNSSTGALVDLVEIRHDTAGTLEIDGSLLAADFFKISTAGLKVLETVEAAEFKATTGATINEFSIDHRLSGASETAVPVERAVLNAMTARFQSPTQHFLATPGWTWCGAPFTGTPSAVTYTRFASWQSITHTGAGTFFYYYPLVNPATRDIRAYVATEYGYTYAGLRIDDGDNNDYTELVLMPGTTTGFLKIQMRYRNGGGGITTTDLVDNLIDQPYYLRLQYSDAANCCNLFYGTENSLVPRYLGASTATWATTASVRAGIYYYIPSANFYADVDWLYDGV
ncbi:MAG: hypothetical protein KKD77_21760, partial [Gammaproteobacteria bacterium]|nr:hypothetical protein [Gammaproteobacteria bacterium]